MSIVKVEIRSRQGNLLTLPLEDYSNGYLVADIQGLDPVNATLVSSEFAALDGEEYQSSSLEKRNIHILLEYKPDYSEGQTVRDLRKNLYRFVTPKSPVTLIFTMEDGLVVEIEGRVESMPTPLFAKEPSVDISIICFKPDFIDPTPVLITGMLTSDTEPHEFEVDGTEETGIEFVMTVATATMSDFTIQHTLPDGSIKTLYLEAPLILNDQVRIDTRKSRKAVTLKRGSVVTSLLYAISPQSDWITLESGINQLWVYTTGAGSPMNIQYVNRYGGL